MSNQPNTYWRNSYFQKYSCQGKVSQNDQGDVVVEGKVTNGPSNATVLYWAACPPNYRTSYSGSALPYPNPEVAYQNTPNRGAVQSSGGAFKIRLFYPNSYYNGLGTTYTPPHVNIKVCDSNGDGQISTISLGDGVPFRMLTYPGTKNASRSNSLFYQGRNRFPIRTQEQIAVDSGYPVTNKMPDNFWGLAVPHP